MKEPRETLYEFAGYMRGRGVSLVEAPLFNDAACTPHISHYTLKFANELKDLRERTFDYVIIGDILAQAPQEVRSEIIQHSVRLLKSKAYLLLALPTNAFTREGIEEELRTTGTAFRSFDSHTVGSFKLFIYQSLGTGSRILSPAKLPRAKRVCVSRLGAIGDMIQLTPLLRQLAEDGFHVTLNCSPNSTPVIKGNPNVHNIIEQERNIIPNTQLGPYWKYWGKRYDKYVNMSESIEGPLLKIQGRRDYYTSKQWRHKKCNVNYFQQTLRRGGYHRSNGTPELFVSRAETAGAWRMLKKNYVNPNHFVLIGVLNGSSHHKTYPLLPAVANDWLDANPDTRLILLGDTGSRKYVWQHKQVIDLCGKTSIREAFALVKVADCIIGPETSLTNASACFPDTAAIVLLSHSTRHNLTSGWSNTQTLAPARELAPCYPCHQLHYTLDSCPQAHLRDDETGENVSSGPICAMGAISGERVYATLDRAYAQWKHNV